jgi:cell division transport system ATP-binding protein
MSSLSNVTKLYRPTFQALKCVSFHLEAGEMAFLTGHSGAGKSTLLKLIAGLEAPTKGQIIVNGKNLARIKKRELPQWRRDIGILLQQPWLLYQKTIFDNVALPLLLTGHRDREKNRRVRAALDIVGLRDKERCRPQTLATGELQRTALARALVIRPNILLADEPTGNLDPQLSEELMDKLLQLNQMGMTMIIASHDQMLTAKHVHKRFNLSQGRLSIESTIASEKSCSTK